MNDRLFAKAKRLYIQGASLDEMALKLGYSRDYFYVPKGNADKLVTRIHLSITTDDYDAMFRCKQANSREYDRLRSFKSDKEKRLEKKSQYLIRRMKIFKMYKSRW